MHRRLLVLSGRVGRFARRAGVVTTTVAILAGGVAPVLSNAQTVPPAPAAPPVVLKWGLNELGGTVAAATVGPSGTYGPTPTFGIASLKPSFGTAVIGPVEATIPSSISAGGAVSFEWWRLGAATDGPLARIGDLGFNKINDPSFWGQNYWFYTGAGIVRYGLGAHR